MSEKQKPVSATVGPWLKANLGSKCLAGCTSVDYRALEASVHLVELMAYAGRSAGLLAAYCAIVSEMTEHNRWLAYHSIAHVLNWEDRAVIWLNAGAPEIPQCQQGIRCKYE
jgi:hypothetical protein